MMATPATANVNRTRWASRAAKKAKRAPVAALSSPIQEAKRTVIDVVSPVTLLAIAVVFSGAGHLWGASMFSRLKTESHPKRQRVRISVVQKSDPPPPIEEPKPKVPPVVPINRPHKKVALNADPPPPTPQEAPPPPNQAAPTADAVPALITGLSLSSTSTSGSFNVAVGNTLHGPANAKPPEDVARPYKAAQYAPLYALTEQPVFLDNVSAAQVRKFYPEEAHKSKLEGIVRVKLTLDDDGSVVKVVVVDDPGHGFGAAAVKLARLYRFKPGRVNGTLVATEIQFTIHFELDEGSRETP